ncbi:putative arylsulfatase A-like [Apostichopus japonicus]|uniref:Putative arylsulfatase A-like n=1 Tax=Stichopus japonicus TaxID=307972 RepID=A0A2G8KSS3_STIJA|nr:putative arylsulfatase A-like [Apostichopus japonicus]
MRHGERDMTIWGLETFLFTTPTSYSPSLNKLANNGLVFTQFYVSSPICTPSRAGLLTGRYATRSGTYPDTFKPDDIGGLPLNETTIAEALKPVGYRTGMIGKWHLGYGKDGQYQPSHQGFDWYYGIPYTHAECSCGPCYYPDAPCDQGNCQPQYVHCPLFANTTIVEQPVDLLTLDAKYAALATDFIRFNAQEQTPFFLYYAFHHLHIPIYSGKNFTKSTIRGHYGDALAELDWAVGEVMDTLEALNIDNNTLIFFSSDNGPALALKQLGGSAGLLKCGKSTTYEGGPRVPGIAYWPGRITPGYTTELASTLDLLPTICSIAEAPLPLATLDGVDISRVLFHGQTSPRETFYYYPGEPEPYVGVYAVRFKQFKAHFFTSGAGNSVSNDPDCKPGNFRLRKPPLLFDLHEDPSEQFDIAGRPEYEGLLQKMIQLKRDFDYNMVWAPSQINRGQNEEYQPCCKAGCTEQLVKCCQCDALDGMPQVFRSTCIAVPRT